MSRTPRGSSRRAGRRIRANATMAAAVLFGAVALSGCGGDDLDDVLAEKGAKGTTATGTAKSGGKDGGGKEGGGKEGGGSSSPDGAPDDDSDPPEAKDSARPAPDITSPIDGVVAYTVERTHEEGPIEYSVTPPVGGAHNPRWLNCGIYRIGQNPTNAVHSMEHGAVWVTYRPDLPKAEVTALETALRGIPYLLMTPYDGLPTPVVASAWGLQLRLDSSSDPRLVQFVTTYVSGPQTPEPGAPCTGGLGRPDL